MKRYFILLLLLSLSCFTKAQVIKIYCYEQAIEGGAQQERNIQIPATGNEVNEAELQKRFFLFAELKKASPVIIEQIYIKGRLYNFKSDTIKRFPFILQTSNGGEMIFRDTLVKGSTNIIIHLKDLVPVNNKNIPSDIRKKITKSNVVIRYRLKNKIQIASLASVKNLRPLFTQ
jgi:hypothetical protein